MVMFPLVTVITPCSRPSDIDRIKEVFISQNYPNKEMLILMDEPGWTKDMDIENKIWQWGLPNASIATKRNHLCEYARGEIICHFDSDDYFAHDWITKTVAHMQSTGADTTGLSDAYFYRPHSQAWKYIWNGKQKYCIGGTLAYKKSIWQNNRFKETRDGFGEDTLFMRGAGRVIPHTYDKGFVAMIHGNNSTSHIGVQTNPRFNAISVAIIEDILGLDYGKYPVK